jgi:hypothetical protein
MAAAGANLCALDLSQIELSAGGGAVLVPYMEGLDIKAPGYRDGHIRNHWVDGGFYGFFDARYIELDLGYYGALFGDYEQSGFGDPLDLKSEYDDLRISYLDIGVLLKYPVKITNTSVITPMAGFSYWINMGADYGYKGRQDAANDLRKKDWDQMWIKAGLGFDQYVTEKLFLRFTAKLNFPIVTQDWTSRGNNITDIFGLVIDGVTSQYLGVGGEFALALGYRIK